VIAVAHTAAQAYGDSVSVQELVAGAHVAVVRDFNNLYAVSACLWGQLRDCSAAAARHLARALLSGASDVAAFIRSMVLDACQTAGHLLCLYSCAPALSFITLCCLAVAPCHHRSWTRSR
jgi:hypothetical protein